MTTSVRTILQVVSWVACGATVIPAILFLSGSMELDQMKHVIMGATVVWFLSASVWMGREKKNHDE